MEIFLLAQSPFNRSYFACYTEINNEIYASLFLKSKIIYKKKICKFNINCTPSWSSDSVYFILDDKALLKLNVYNFEEIKFNIATNNIYCLCCVKGIKFVEIINDELKYYNNGILNTSNEFIFKRHFIIDCANNLLISRNRIIEINNQLATYINLLGFNVYIDEHFIFLTKNQILIKYDFNENKLINKINLNITEDCLVVDTFQEFILIKINFKNIFFLYRSFKFIQKFDFSTKIVESIFIINYSQIGCILSDIMTERRFKIFQIHDAIKINEIKNLYINKNRRGFNYISLISKNNVKAMVMLHGGPAYHFDTSYNAITKYFSLKQYDVYLLNVHGSTDQGIEFRNSLIGNIGIVDALDVQTFIDSIKDKYEIVDLYGESYGGYLAALLITKYKVRLNKVIVLNGFTNILCQLTDSINKNALKFYFKGNENIEEINPICFSELYSPVKFLHLKDDKICDIKQIYSFREKIKNKNIIDIYELESGCHDIVSTNILLSSIIKFL